MSEKKTYNVGQKALLRRIKILKISEEEKAEIIKFAKFVFKQTDEK